MEMLKRSLRQVLALRDRLRLEVALDERRANAALAKIDREPEPDWTRADNENIRFVMICHGQRSQRFALQNQDVSDHS
jgi:hypothetical protein